MSLNNISNYLFLLVIVHGFNNCFSQSTNFIVDQNRDRKLIWCVVGPEEMKKCQAFAEAVTKDISYFGGDILQLTCKSGFNKEECMSLVDEEKAHITSLDAGEVFVGGRYHSLIPIMQEIYPGGLRSYYAVAVIKKGALPEVSNLRHLRGKKACFAGVGTQAGWVIPVYTLMREGGMEVIDCNNHVKSTINYFGPSCAVNSLIDKYNPIGDNSDKLCQLCIGRVPGEKCTSADPYSGFEGAFRCLVEAGDIAFLKHTTVLEMTRFKHEYVSVQNSDFELLCRDGTRRPVDAYISCNWGSVPPHAVVTTSAKPAKLRRTYQRFLEKASQLYGGKYTYTNETSTRSTTPNPQNSYQPKSYQPNEYEYQRNQFGFRQDEYQPKDSQQNAGIPNNTFHLFESAPRYGLKHNLLFQDAAENLEELSEGKQTYTGYLGETLNLILAVRQCPVNRMTMCVTSDPELEKCIKMRTALKAQLLKPEMICYKGHSQIHCMQAIRNGNADVAVLDAGDVYTAGLNYDLIPFISEIYDLGSPEYYVVAVAKEEDPSTELTYLKGKLTCHPGVNTGAGWIVPLAYLISNGWMRPYGCDSMRAAAEYFSKSCVPGALSTEYNTGVPYDNMCDLCHGASFRYCRRDASEAYYGYTGAFKCLVEGGGHVAFLKHTTVMENADGKRKEWWARNILNEDFELLCPDGTRSTMHDYRRCNLGTVKANAIVTRGGEAWNGTEINAFINLFIYAQQFYGRKDPDEFSFSMFYSQPPYSDLIFQDAATQLQVIPTPLRYYDTYLGKDFMRAKRIVDCHAGSDASVSNVMLVLSLTLLSAVPAVLMGRGFI